MAYSQSMTDVAFSILGKRKKEVEFAKLWTEVAKQMKVPEEKQRKKKSQFYSELMLDSRFAALEGNKWDLRNRRKFEEVHIMEVGPSMGVYTSEGAVLVAVI